MPTYKKDIFQELDTLARHLNEEAKLLAERIANIYYVRLKGNIETNKFGFSLADKTIAMRILKGIGSDVPLIETGEYLMAIVLDGTRVTVKEGIHRGNRKNNHRLTYEELSYILEYGRFDKSVPAFPVWRKTYEECQPIIKQMIDDFASKQLPRRRR